MTAEGGQRCGPGRAGVERGGSARVTWACLSSTVLSAGYSFGEVSITPLKRPRDKECQNASHTGGGQMTSLIKLALNLSTSLEFSENSP